MLYFSSQVKVCIPDSGIVVSHPDLQDTVLDGWNLVPFNRSSGEVVQPGEKAYKMYNDVTGHGTGGAGIVAARTNNAFGVASVGDVEVSSREGG